MLMASIWELRRILMEAKERHAVPQVRCRDLRRVSRLQSVEIIQYRGAFL